MKRLVSQGDLLLSAKAANRLVQSGFTIADLEQAILTGSVKKKERDERDRAAFKFTSWEHRFRAGIFTPAERW